MPRIIKNIPIMDLASFLMETPDTPVSIGSVQILQPVSGSREEVIARILKAYRESEVDAPFNYVPVFPKLGLPKWAECDHIDTDYHIRELHLEAPGTDEQLIQTVMDLHEPLLDRTKPGWIAYIISGLANNRFAIYVKMQHAYIDGASALMRMEAVISRNAEALEARPIWARLFPQQEKPRQGLFNVDMAAATDQFKGMLDVGAALRRSLLQARGKLKRDMPLPFSAPETLFNRPVHAKRRLGIGSGLLARVKTIARQESVSVNEVLLTIVGHALETYQQEHGETNTKPLVAICPIAIRDPGDTEAATKIAGISVALGTPGSGIARRLGEVHASSRDAKGDAAKMTNEALMQYMLVIAGIGGLLQKIPTGRPAPQMTNVNVSNVAGLPYRCFISGAEILHTYPVSTLAGGTAINITFGSEFNRIDFAVIADVEAVPEPQGIANLIVDALALLEKELGLSGKTKKATTVKTKAVPKKTAKTKGKADKTASIRKKKASPTHRKPKAAPKPRAKAKERK